MLKLVRFCECIRKRVERLILQTFGLPALVFFRHIDELNKERGPGRNKGGGGADEGEKAGGGLHGEQKGLPTF